MYETPAVQLRHDWPGFDPIWALLIGPGRQTMCQDVAGLSIAQAGHVDRSARQNFGTVLLCTTAVYVAAVLSAEQVLVALSNLLVCVFVLCRSLPTGGPGLSLTGSHWRLQACSVHW